MVLLANQAAGDPRAPLSWSGHLEELLTEDPAQAGSSIIGSMGDSDRQVAVVL